MKEQYDQIRNYFDEYGIKEWTVQESNNVMGHTMNVIWTQEDIRCEKRIFSVDNAMLKMAEQFHMTRNIIRANAMKY